MVKGCLSFHCFLPGTFESTYSHGGGGGGGEGGVGGGGVKGGAVREGATLEFVCRPLIEVASLAVEPQL